MWRTNTQIQYHNNAATNNYDRSAIAYTADKIILSTDWRNRGCNKLPAMLHICLRSPWQCEQSSVCSWLSTSDFTLFSSLDPCNSYSGEQDVGLITTIHITKMLLCYVTVLQCSFIYRTASLAVESNLHDSCTSAYMNSASNSRLYQHVVELCIIPWLRFSRNRKVV